MSKANSFNSTVKSIDSKLELIRHKKLNQVELADYRISFGCNMT